jgi:hypothetical protein
MPGAYRYVVEERAVQSLLFVSDEEQDFLLAYFRLLASRPHSEGAAWRFDDTGRKNFADTAGPFTVVHWTDHALREVRIVEFMRS